MSATIVEEGLNELEAFEQQQTAEAAVTKTPEDDIPEKYRGKSPAELARIALEQEKFIGKQAQEVGEVRRLADELIKQQLQQKPKAPPQPADEELTDVDFFADPVKAVNKAVEKHPAVMQAKLAAAEMQKKTSLDRLTSSHPDYKEVLADEGFKDWVSKSRIRQQLFAHADRNYDVEAAHELLSNYKELRQKREAVVTEGANQLREDTQRAIKAVAVPSGGSGESSKKIYRRADLINLQLKDPDRYMQLEKEILAAYVEGRVR